MRIHTDKLSWSDVYHAAAKLPGVDVTASEHRSRSRSRAFEVQLEGNGYARNSGIYGADTGTQSATWDEWGAFLSALYKIDPQMLVGSAAHPTYRDAADFHWVTDGRYVDGMPVDAHKRHRWNYSRYDGKLVCAGCSAAQNRRR